MVQKTILTKLIQGGSKSLISEYIDLDSFNLKKNNKNIMAVTTNLKNIFTSHIIKLLHTLFLVYAFRFKNHLPGHIINK